MVGAYCGVVVEDDDERWLAWPRLFERLEGMLG